MTTTNALGTQPQNKFYVPTFTNLANTSSFSNLQSMYTVQDIVPGSICIVSSTFTYTPTAISAVFSISIPIGGNFSGGGKANFMGGTSWDTATQANFSNIRELVSAAGDAVVVSITIPVSVINATNQIQLSFMYEIQ